jgi:formylglycine-generating enzyme required for sulfatase activity
MVLGVVLGSLAWAQSDLDEVRARAQQGEFEVAERLLDEWLRLGGDAEMAQQVREELRQWRLDQITNQRQRIEGLIEDGQFEAASAELNELIAMGDQRQQVTRLRQALADARLYGRYRPGQVLSDALPRLDQQGPAMVVVPAGQFMMGSPNTETGREASEGPRRRVRLDSGFALSVTEITVAQFAAFVDDTGYRSDVERSGFGVVYEPRTRRMDRRRGIDWRHDYLGEPADDQLPVIRVSFNDAAAYTRWLANNTGHAYRLPSEAEYEYALRAGSQSRYWWGGGSPDQPIENLTGDGDRSPTGATWSVAFRGYADGHWGPAPAASFPANPFGLHDMGGNVKSWVEDCWHDSYVRAPSDARAWVNPGCTERVVRGGSWASTPTQARSAFRMAAAAAEHSPQIGFRVARALTVSEVE